MKKIISFLLVASMIVCASACSDNQAININSEIPTFESSFVAPERNDMSSNASEESLCEDISKESPSFEESKEDISEEFSDEVSEESSEEVSEEISEEPPFVLPEGRVKLVTDLFQGGYPVAELNGYIYYANEKNFLMGRVKPDGSDRLLYKNPNMLKPLVFDNVIVYVDIRDYKIYSMNHDETDVQCRSEVPTYDATTIYPMTLPENVIYFYKKDTSDTYSLNIDTWETKEQECIHNPGYILDDDPYVQFDSNFYYYTNGHLHDFRLFRCKLGFPTEYLTDFPTYFFFVTDDNVFYTSREEVGLFVMDNDGSNKRKIYDGDIDPIHFFAKDDVVYYTSYTAHFKGLVRMNSDGTGKQILDENATGIIKYTGDYIIFRGNHGHIFSIKTDGTDLQELYPDPHYYEVRTDLITPNGIYFSIKVKISYDIYSFERYYFEF